MATKKGPKQEASGSPEGRPYHSPLRKQQAEQTRELIVEALADQVWHEGLADFSVPKVAKRAGIATRTVYRHFPSRDDLLDAVGEWIQKRSPEPPPPKGLDDLTRYVRELYAYFDQNRQLVDLAAMPELGREVQLRGRARRAAGTREALARWMPEVPDERERLRRFAPVRVLLGSRTWLQLTDEIGFTSEEAAEVACDAIERLLRSYRPGG